MGNTSKIVDNRTSVARKFEVLKQKLEEYPKEVFRKLAQIVVDTPNSMDIPIVDTGTYMDNHHISDIGKRQYGRGVDSSHDKPRGQPSGPYRDAALARLYAEIEAIPKDGKWTYFYNTSKHAPYVEERYTPYQNARSEFRTIVETAWRSLDGN